MDGRDREITIAWPLLVGNVLRYGQYVALEHQSISLQNYSLGNELEARRHITIACDMICWLAHQPTDSLHTLFLLCRDSLVLDRVEIGIDYNYKEDALRYAKGLITKSEENTEDFAPTIMTYDFLFGTSLCDEAIVYGYHLPG